METERSWPACVTGRTCDDTVPCRRTLYSLAGFFKQCSLTFTMCAQCRLERRMGGERRRRRRRESELSDSLETRHYHGKRLEAEAASQCLNVKGRGGPASRTRHGPPVLRTPEGRGRGRGLGSRCGLRRRWMRRGRCPSPDTHLAGCVHVSSSLTGAGLALLRSFPGPPSPLPSPSPSPSRPPARWQRATQTHSLPTPLPQLFWLRCLSLHLHLPASLKYPPRPRFSTFPGPS